MAEEEKQKIERRDIIHLDYDLWVADDNILVETTHKELADENDITEENAVYEPKALIVDEGKVVSGLYKSLLSAEVGNEYELEVPPEDGLGNRDPKLVEWHMMNDIRRQKLEAAVGQQITIKDKSGKERTGVVTMMSPRRVRVDYNNPLAGKTLRYKYKVMDKAQTAEEKISIILEYDFGRKDDFEIKTEGEAVDIKLPDVCKYDQFWLIAKYKIVNDLREYAGFKTIRFTEEYVKKEEKKEEEKEGGEEKDEDGVEQKDADVKEVVREEEKGVKEVEEEVKEEEGKVEEKREDLMEPREDEVVEEKEDV